MHQRVRFTRRELLGLAASGAAITSLAGCAATPSAPPLGRVVVVGGGWGGATAAKYLRIWGEGRIEVTLVEPNEQFVSCPMSNLVIGGSRTMAQITQSYDGLSRYGIRRVRDRATRIDTERRQVLLAAGEALPYDRVVLAPGIDFIFEAVAGMSAQATERIPHAWRAGPQTQLLRDQLLALRDGGTVVMSVPAAPYRCPPGPYERACQIAGWLKKARPRSKLIVLDANPDLVSKKGLFLSMWNNDYKAQIEYRPNASVTEVDAAARQFVLELGDRVGGDVLNLIPPQRAGDIARSAGLATANNRWCPVDWMSMASTLDPRIHVIGDAALAAPAMPKSGHMANQHGKVAAAAIVELMNGRSPVPPTVANTCYSYVDDTQAVHVSSVHRWDPATRTVQPVTGAGGLSPVDRRDWAREGEYAWAWARQVWADMLT